MEEQPALNSTIGPSTGLRELFQQLSRKRRREFVHLIGLMLLGAVVELATIGSVVPFLALLSRQNATTPPSLPARLLGSIGPGFGSRGLVTTAAVFASLAVAAGLIRIELAWLTRGSTTKSATISPSACSGASCPSPTAFTSSRHSSTLITATDKVEVLVFNVLSSR